MTETLSQSISGSLQQSVDKQQLGNAWVILLNFKVDPHVRSILLFSQSILLIKTLLLCLVIAKVEGLTAIVIGGIVGAVNGAIDGGIGAGIEWILIVSSASVLGTWYWQFQIGSYWLFGVVTGMIGGVVGFLTWKCFHTAERPNSLSAMKLLSYLVSFALIAFVSPMTMEFMIFIFDD